MTGLLIKDLLNVKKYVKTLFIVVAIYAIWAVAANNVTFVAAFIPLLFAMTVFNSFTFDESNKWNELAISFPLKRTHFIFSKYIFSILFVCFGNLCSILIIFLTSGVKKTPIDVTEFSTILFGTFLVGITFISIVIPLIVILGIEKTRIAMFAILVLPSVLLVAISKAGSFGDIITEQQLNNMIHFVTSNLPVISILLSILFLFISCCISCIAFSKKEF